MGDVKKKVKIKRAGVQRGGGLGAGLPSMATCTDQRGFADVMAIRHDISWDARILSSNAILLFGRTQVHQRGS